MFLKLIKLPALFVLAVLFFTACNKDLDIEPTENPETTITDNSANVRDVMTSDSSGCYSIAFPITFVYEDGTTVTASTEADLEDIFMSEPYPFDLGYPVNLEDPATGEVVVAEDEEALITFLSACDFDIEIEDPIIGGGYCDSLVYGDIGSLGCFDIEYPVSFVLADGSTVTVQSDDDLEDIFQVNNPPVDFAYPINLTNLFDGTTAIANNADELGDLLIACDFEIGDPIDGGYCDSLINTEIGFLGCYDIAYPVSFTLADGSTVTAESDEALTTLFNESNPPVDFAYPINLISLIDGTTQTANDATELETLLSACNDFPGFPGDSTIIIDHPGSILPLLLVSIELEGTPQCYNFQYPVNLVNMAGETSTVSSDEALTTAAFESFELLNFAYPVQVIDISSGEVVTVNNDDEALQLAGACF